MKKIVKLHKLFRDRMKDSDVTKYLLGMEPISYQGMIYYAETSEKMSDSTYEGLKTLEFYIEFLANQYIN